MLKYFFSYLDGFYIVCEGTTGIEACCSIKELKKKYPICVIDQWLENENINWD